MLEKFLALLERIADALEVIAAHKTGNDAPRTEPPSTPNTTTKTDTSAADKKKAEKEAKDKAKAEKAAAEKAKAAAEDPLSGADPFEGVPEEKREYTEKDVREILSKLIDKEGRQAAFDVLKEKGNAKAFTDLKKDKYEDVYVECEQRLAD